MFCLVCGSPNPDQHHITSRGAGGGDYVWLWDEALNRKTQRLNICPLCRKHHQEYHLIGPVRFFKKYARFRYWLEDHKRTDILDKELKLSDKI